VALEEHLAPTELAGYISRRGGIGEIHETELKAEARELGAKFSKERLDLLREFLSLQQWEDCTEFKYDQPIMQHNADKQTKSENATFCVFIADYDQDKDVYRIINGHDLGKRMKIVCYAFSLKVQRARSQLSKKASYATRKNCLMKI
jgi:hypothetical protein